MTCRHKVNGICPCQSGVIGNEVPCPLVVGTIGDDKLDLIGRAQHAQVRPQHALVHAAARTLDVDNPFYPFRDDGDVKRPVGLKHHPEVFPKQCAQQLNGCRLKQRLAACHLHQCRTESTPRQARGGLRQAQSSRELVESTDPFDNLPDRHGASTLVGIGGVAPSASKVAARQSNERAGQPRTHRFTLYGAEYLGDLESCSTTLTKRL